MAIDRAGCRPACRSRRCSCIIPQDGDPSIPYVQSHRSAGRIRITFRIISSRSFTLACRDATGCHGPSQRPPCPGTATNRRRIAEPAPARTPGLWRSRSSSPAAQAGTPGTTTAIASLHGISRLGSVSTSLCRSAVAELRNASREVLDCLAAAPRRRWGRWEDGIWRGTVVGNMFSGVRNVPQGSVSRAAACATFPTPHERWRRAWTSRCPVSDMPLGGVCCLPGQPADHRVYSGDRAP